MGPGCPSGDTSDLLPGWSSSLGCCLVLGGEEGPDRDVELGALQAHISGFWKVQDHSVRSFHRTRHPGPPRGPDHYQAMF
ncbi:hypothetical protein NDU88_000654 [Pleurodeles waltl]|uniref:Uncharacterized protein n=1 Tax=Pleurodeles waltl TaxID=8319 RepID=A0AAV7S6A0_PLEWA|nr:hypothetical protein NDU88_000654 [Pleurodeles waltl]